MAQLRIGTSGWNYNHWRERFYPEGVSQKHWLEYYAQHFSTAEVNYSFYRLPAQSTYENWLSAVPDDFMFTLKCSRLITHNKRLGNLKDLWVNFLTNALALGDQLGPILLQLPDNFEINTERLSEFLSDAPNAIKHDLNLRLAVEFRHESWFVPQVYKILEKHNVALVAASSSLFPRADRVTADFAYFRYHGPGALFGSNYTRKQLEQEADKMAKLLRQRIDVFGYFNNDGNAYAVKNAQALQEMLSRRETHRRAG
jgi:uncharacterized protein YecE (DUF72 family)